MTNRIADISQRKAARVAGFGYLIIIIAGIFPEFFVRFNLIEPLIRYAVFFNPGLWGIWLSPFILLVV